MAEEQYAEISSSERNILRQALSLSEMVDLRRRDDAIYRLNLFKERILEGHDCQKKLETALAEFQELDAYYRRSLKRHKKAIEAVTEKERCIKLSKRKITKRRLSEMKQGAMRVGTLKDDVRGGFHNQCAEKWLMGGKGLCPICRACVFCQHHHE